MDPVIGICRIKDSTQDVQDSINQTYTYISNKINSDLKYNFKSSDNNDNSNDINSISKIKLDQDIIITAYTDSLFNPFQDYTGKFKYHDSLVLADIDASFNISNRIGGYIIKQDYNNFNYGILNDGPGGFTEYLQYRLPISYGFGMTPSRSCDNNCTYDNCFQEGWNNWDTQIIDMTHFNITCGKSGTGDLNKDYNSYISHVKKVNAPGLDLLVINDGNDGNNTSIDYITKLITSLQVLKVGGNMVCKLPGITDKLLVELLYITSKCFKKISLFKPLATDLRDDITFIIAQDLNSNNLDTYLFLEDSYNKIKNDTSNHISLISEVPTSFISWLNGYLAQIDNYRLEVIELNNTGVSALYNTFKCKAVWNLP